MELYKNFEFKGLFQAGRKMAQPWGYFRRCTNVYKDKSKTLRHFGPGEAEENEPTNLRVETTDIEWLGTVASAVYRGAIVQLIRGIKDGFHYGAFRYFQPGFGDLDIVQPSCFYGELDVMTLEESDTYLPAGNFTTAIVREKLYINEYVDRSKFSNVPNTKSSFVDAANLMRFDGISFQRAGLPTPWKGLDPIGSAAYDHNFRFVYMAIGLDGEVVLSNYLEQNTDTPTFPPLHLIYAGGYEPIGAAKLADAVGTASCSFPKIRYERDSLFDFPSKVDNAVTLPNYYDRRWLLTDSTTVTESGGEFTCGLDQYGLIAPGDWVITNAESIGEYYAFRLRIKEMDPPTGTATSVTFEKDAKAFNMFTSSWEDVDLDILYNDKMTPTQQTAWLESLEDCPCTNIYNIVCYNYSGTYKVCALLPILWEATGFSYAIPAVVPDVALFPFPIFGVITNFMLDWYDINNVKTTFPPVVGITNYSELLVGFDRKALYWNDITLGGSTDMVSGFSNLIPFGSEYGDLVAICGSEDFLFFSRERKNYVLRGELTTGAVSITECDSAVKGAANARAVSNGWGGEVIFMNSTGIYSVTSSGAIKEISEMIRGLFIGSNVDSNLFDKTVFKTAAQRITDGYDGSVFKISLDEERGFILFLTGKVNQDLELTGSNLLVFDTNDGTWYEFRGYGAASVEAMLGRIHGLGVEYRIEDGVLRTAEDAFFATVWMTVDSPSLDKQVNQIVLFGSFTQADDDSYGVNVGQQNNWQAYTGTTSLWNTFKKYVADATTDYRHQQRLNSSKPKATSIIVSALPGGGFEIEGMEIEGGALQEGPKK